jgi:hypothetical protein
MDRVAGATNFKVYRGTLNIELPEFCWGEQENEVKFARPVSGEFVRK